MKSIIIGISLFFSSIAFAGLEDVTIKEVRSRSFVYKELKFNTEDQFNGKMEQTMRGQVISIGLHVSRQRGTIVGDFRILFPDASELDTEEFTVQAGFNVRGRVSKKGLIKVRKTPKFRCGEFHFVGDRLELDGAITQVEKELVETGHELTGEMRQAFKMTVGDIDATVQIGIH